MRPPRASLWQALIALALGSLVLGYGCGDDSAGPGGADTQPPVRDSVSGADTTDDDADTAVAADTGDHNPPPALDLDFTVAFSYIGRNPASNLGESDLWLMAGDGGTRHSVTNFVRTDPDAVGFSCANSCILDDALSWIAVATGPRDERGVFEFAIGRFDQRLTVAIEKTATLGEIIDLRFAGPYLYYTRRSAAGGDGQQYGVSRLPLDRPQSRQELFDFPPDDQLGRSIYRGRFSASPDGSTLLFLSPTIFSQSVYVWREGEGLTSLGEICQVERFGSCADLTGSQYTDADPAAVSPDGRYVALFAVRQQAMKVFLWDLTEPQVRHEQALARVALEQDYTQQTSCQNLEPGQFSFVRGRPQFTKDSRALVFLGWTDCSSGDERKKPETDILRLSVARIMSAVPLAAGEIENLTETPKTNNAHQIVIESFDLSPAGDVLVFTGSPTFSIGGNVLGDTDRRQREDRELWVQHIADPRTRRQLTNDLEWRAGTPKALPAAQLP
jgi:hypothetical protein